MGGFAAIAASVRGPVDIAIEGMRENSYDRVCTESGCANQFPTITGLGIPIGVRVADRIDLAAGPGVYYRFVGEHDRGNVGGLTAHAALRIVNAGPIGLTASVRPLVTFGPRLYTRERIALITYSLGLRW